MNTPEPRARGGSPRAAVAAVARGAALSALLLVAAPSARGASPTDAKTLLQRWTDAIGGRLRLERIRTGHMRETGRWQGTPIEQETWWDATGAHRMRRDVLGRVTTFTFDGKQGWRTDWSGSVSDLRDPSNEFQDAYLLSGSHLLPHRRQGSVVAAAPDSAGRAALLIRARDGADETWYFDAATGLPAAVVRTYRDSTQAFREYFDWRDVEGVRMPFMTVFWNGADRDTVRVVDVAWDEPAPAFGRPEGGPKPWRIADGKTARDIPIEINNNHILLHGWIQNRDSVRVALDSGAGADVLLASRAQTLGLAVDGEHEALGAGGTARAGTVRNVTLAFPDLTLVDHTFDTLPLDQLGPTSGHPIDAIVGYPLFSRNVVMIDYEHSRLTVIDGEGWTYHGQGAVLPLTFESNLPYVTARITLPGQAPVEGRFVLDTGNAGNLALGPSFVAEHQAIAAAGKTIEIVSRGVGGETRNPIGRVAKLELGGVTFEQPVTAFRSPGAGYISAPGTVGNIGGGILRRFTCIFDYPRRRLILEPNSHVRDPFEYDMSGLVLRAVPPEFARVTVGIVLPSSPASDLGITPGDEIETIDGRPAGAMTLDAIRTLLRREGASVQLGIKHGEDHRDVTLVTRRLI